MERTVVAEKLEKLPIPNSFSQIKKGSSHEVRIIHISPLRNQFCRTGEIVVGKCFHQITRRMLLQNQLNDRVMPSGGGIVTGGSKLFVFMPWISSGIEEHGNNVCMALNGRAIQCRIALKVFQVWICSRSKEVLHDGELSVPRSIHQGCPTHWDYSTKKDVVQWLNGWLAPSIHIGSCLDPLLDHPKKPLGGFVPQLKFGFLAKKFGQHSDSVPNLSSKVRNMMTACGKLCLW